MSVSRKIYGTVYCDEAAAHVFNLMYGMSLWDLASMSDDINVMSIEMGMLRLDIGLTDMPPGIEFLEAWLFESHARRHEIHGSISELNLEESPWMAVFHTSPGLVRQHITFVSLHGEDGMQSGPLKSRNPQWPVPLDEIVKEK